MSLEPTSLTHNDPHDARRASAVNADGTLLYKCINCSRPKPQSQFGNNEYGRVNDACLDCERLSAAGVPHRKFMKDRSHITVQSKRCKGCDLERPSDEFWLNAKGQHGLNDYCGDCVRKKRGYKSAMPVPQYDAYTPASALQPALDQAVAERDELESELESLRAMLTEMRQTAQNQAPRTDLLALNAIETEIRWLRERLEAQEATQPITERYVRRGLQKASLLIGPVAYAIFKWADKQVLGYDGERKEKPRD